MVIMTAYRQYSQSYAIKNTLLCIIIPIYLDRLQNYSLTLRYLVQVTLEEITGREATFTPAL